MLEVIIYKLEEGIFYSELICEQAGIRIAVDSRTSDAVALALRFKCPIYTTEDILLKAGIVIEVSDELEEGQVRNDVITKESDNKYDQYTITELEEMLNEEVNNENYELAASLRDLTK